MAQSADPQSGLDGFLSIIQSLATQFPPPPSTTTASTLATSTSSQPASTAVSATSVSSTSAITSSATSSPTPAAAAAVSTGLSSTARTAIIVVCSVVGALLLALLALLICCCLRRRRKQRSEPIAKEETKEIDTPLRADDWYHGNDSHHGYIGAPVTDVQRPSQDKNPRHSVSSVVDPNEPPNLADHPAFAREAFARDSDPYKAAGVGSVALAGAGAGVAAARKSREDPDRRSRSISERRSLGERRLSDHMPARKPVGSPPSMPGRNRASNPLRIDTGTTGAAAVAAGAGALTASATSAHRPGQDSPYYPRDSTTTNPFTSPAGPHPEPTATSPLSSHPSNPLLVGGTSRKHDSYHSQRSPDDAIQPAETALSGKSKGKRPPTPLGFDFGLPQPDTTTLDDTAYPPESEPLTSDFEHQPLTAPVVAPVSKFSNNRRSSPGTGIAAPTTAQRDSLNRRSLHYLDNDNADLAPEVPQRSPRRLSRGSFDEPTAGNDDIAVPPRSPKRMSWTHSSENIGGTGAATAYSPPQNVFRDSGDFAYSSYPSSRSAYSGSPRRGSGSPRMGPALGHRNRSNSNLPTTSYARNSASELGPHGQLGSPYSPARSQAFARNAGYPVYGHGGDSNAASSVESWVSARQQPVPTPWEDNAIRRNSSSGQLRRPKSLVQQQQESGSSAGEGVMKRTRDSRHADSGQFSGASPTEQRGLVHGYEGRGGYDSSWGEGNVEEPVFEKYGAQRSRRRSSAGSGFDPRYGRWTSSTYDEEFGTGMGVGEAI